jgi:hypothetical protein
VYKFLIGKPEGKIFLRRPIYRLENNINMQFFEKYGGCVWDLSGSE